MNPLDLAFWSGLGLLSTLCLLWYSLSETGQPKERTTTKEDASVSHFLDPLEPHCVISWGLDGSLDLFCSECGVVSMTHVRLRLDLANVLWKRHLELNHSSPMHHT